MIVLAENRPKEIIQILQRDHLETTVRNRVILPMNLTFVHYRLYYLENVAMRNCLY